MKVLWCSEASVLSTGYATYSRQILENLYKKPNIEIAEFASYITDSDPRKDSLPWKVYPNVPDESNEQAINDYNSKVENQFGAYRFEEVCLDFKPDIVVSIRDFWMDSHIETSPFRPYFKWIWMPTCDATPQNEQWLSSYISTDLILTYQDWSKNILEEESGGKIKVFASAPPCSPKEMKVIDREKIKRAFGLQDKYIIGTVMRNQRRKLFPQLFSDFKQFLDETKRQDIYLYCHTSYPDLCAWDIPKLLLKNGITSKVYFTYVCKNCGHAFPSLFNDAITSCIKCGNNSAVTANVKHGVNNDILCVIYNMFDLYVQYSNCLTPNTPIYTSNGWKKISEIKTGEYVYTHKHNFKPVLNTFKHNVSQKIKRISVCSDYSVLEISDEHPVYCIQTNREKLGDLIRLNKELPEPKFVKARDLKTNDMLVYNIDDSSSDIEKFDLALNIKHEKEIIFNNEKIAVHKGDFYNRYIDIDYDFCKFLGLYVADGTYSINNNSKSVRMTCHEKDVDIIEFSNNMLYKLSGKKPSIRKYKHSKAFSIESYSYIVAKLFELCGKLENKQLPSWSLSLPHDKQEEIIIGWAMGDGHYDSDRKVTTVVTISKTLSEQIKFILRRLRLNYNVRIDIRDENRKPQYRFEIQGDIKNGEFIINNNTKYRNLYLDNKYLIQIKNIEDIQYEGNLYNFEVEEDNSYMSDLSVLHNSEGFGIPQVEAASCGVPIMSTDYSAMSDVVRKLGGIPIKVLHYDLEIETGCYRAIPNSKHFIGSLKKFFSYSENKIKNLRKKTKELCDKNYNWQETANKWEEAILSFQPQDLWRSEARIRNPSTNIPNHYNNSQFARWLITDVLCEPEKLNTYMETRLIKDLNYGYTTGVVGGMYYNEFSMLSYRPNTRELEFNREKAYYHFADLCHRRNYWEKRRING